jgi:primosomal protein N' (replication factor Y)
VVLLDCAQTLGKDTLRASEDAVRNWSNAIAKLAISGRAVAVGLGGELGQWLALWNQEQIAERIVAERRELGFPPAERLLSATGTAEVVAKAEAELAEVTGLTLLGKTSVRAAGSTEPQLRLLGRYGYSAGPEVAKAVMALQLKLAAGTARGGRPGRASRALTVKMDDGEVI